MNEFPEPNSVPFGASYQKIESVAVAVRVSEFAPHAEADVVTGSAVEDTTVREKAGVTTEHPASLTETV